MRAAGLDIGSRTIKLLILDPEQDVAVTSLSVETTYDPVSQCRKIMAGAAWDNLVTTGYGRRLIAGVLSASSITEIQAHALGARRLFPDAGSVLDIGGQDTKAISLDGRGAVRKFEMNDRCAAGTGKFLEFMATSFQVPISEFGAFALQGEPGLAINSMCTVFAESEATSLMARGNKPQDIALALHVSVVKRSLSMLKRMWVHEPLVFSGGVAKNPCAVKLIEELGGYPVLLPEEPDMVGALGAAIHCASLTGASLMPFERGDLLRTSVGESS
jgi:(R)-2-hydroxyacyl-CoA dehydratese activating ATPase